MSGRIFSLNVKLVAIILTGIFVCTVESRENNDGSKAGTTKTLHLLVIDKETQKSVPDVELTIRNIQGETDVVTDKNGEYNIVMPGEDSNYVSVRVKKEGYITIRAGWGGNYYVKQAPSKYTLAIEKGTTIGGKVQNEQGETIEGVTVGIYYIRDFPNTDADIAIRIFPSETNTKTDQTGHWQVNKLPSEFTADELRIFLTHPDYVSDNLRPGYIPMPVAPQPSVSSLRDLSSIMVMKKGISLGGRVLGPKGEPIKGALIREGIDQLSRAYPDYKTDDDGNFVLENVKAGTVTLTVQATGYSPDMKKVVVKERMESVEFRLAPGHIVTGRIVDKDGHPVANANIGVEKWRGNDLLEWRTVTDAEGRFQWNEAPADAALCYVTAQDYMSLTNYLIIGSDKKIEITLQPPLKVHGKVLDAKTGEPVPEFRMITGIQWETSDSIYWQRDNLKTFTDGNFENKINYPYYGHYIQIEADGYLPAISHMFRSDEGDVVYDFKLEKASGLSGMVFLPDGKPAKGAEVILCTPSGSMYLIDDRDWRRRSTPYVITKQDGRFSFPAQTERYIIFVFHNDGYAKIIDSKFEGSSKIVLQPYTNLKGKFLIKDEPKESQKIYLTYINPEELSDIRIAHERRTETDSDGNFEFNHIPPGQAILYWEIRNDTRGSLSHGVALDIKSRQINNVSIGGKGRPVTGKILIPDYIKSKIDWKYSDTMLGINSPDNPYTQIVYTIKKDGSFRVEDVPAGDYVLFFSVYALPESENSFPTKRIGMVTHSFHVPDMKGGESDEPFDLGELELEVVDKLSYIPSLIDKALPELKDFIDLPQADIQNKSMLLCFWDNEQRPSSKCILELSKKADELKAKGIEVLLIHASKIEHENLDDWLKENNITFPVGIIDSNEEQTRFDWGVKALPWLILTDKEHIVTAEGFSINELDEKLKN